jgi:signal transduction histidine kinase
VRYLIGAAGSVLVCLIVGLLVAVALGLPPSDAMVLVATATAASSAVALCAVVPFRRSYRRTMQAQAMLMATAIVLTALAGVVAAAVAMFISSHDFKALMVVLVVAAGTSTGLALQLSWGFGRDADIVRALTGTLARAGGPDDTIPQSAADLDLLSIEEMHDLAVQLQAATDSLASARRHERTLERSRRELVAWISHDLRSPLASIRALAEALEDDIVTETADRQAYYSSIRREAERLGVLVDDLFELSRVQAGNVSPNPSRIPVHELVSDVLGGMGPSAGCSGVTVQVDVDCIGDDLVPAADLLRVLRNLLDNAVRHTPEGGTVRLEGGSTQSGVVLRVIDECGGIPEQDLARVFDVAFRGDVARQRDSGGGGLGLAIAKGLVEAHAGQIEVHNHALGCRFEVRVPTTPAGSSGLLRGEGPVRANLVP